MLEQTKTHVLIFFIYYSISTLVIFNSWVAREHLPVQIFQNQVLFFKAWHTWLDGFSFQTYQFTFFFPPVLDPMTVGFAILSTNVFAPVLYIYSKPPPSLRSSQFFSIVFLKPKHLFSIGSLTSLHFVRWWYFFLLSFPKALWIFSNQWLKPARILTEKVYGYMIYL